MSRFTAKEPALRERHPQLAAKRGASIAEFVIIAPILTLLGLAAYDMNKRLEDAQNVAIITHNTVYLGSLDDSANARRTVRGSAIKALTDYDPAQPDRGDRGMSKSVERGERREMAQDPTQGTIGAGRFKAGTYVVATKEDKLAAAETDRALQPAGIKPVSGTFADFYKATMRGLNSTLPPVNTAMDVYHDVFSITGMDAAKNTRSATVEMRLSGESNALVQSIDSLGRIWGKDDGDKAMTRRFSSRKYLISKTAYHAEDYRQAALVGAGIGFVAYGSWSGYKFDRTSRSMQERCMTTLTTEDTCETGTGSRDFLNAVRAIATIRYTISGILTAFVISKPADVAISVAGEVALKAVFDALSGALRNTLETELAKAVAAPIEKVKRDMTDNLTDKMTSFGRDFMPDTAGMAHRLGE